MVNTGRILKIAFEKSRCSPFTEATRDRHVQLHHLIQEWLYLGILEESALALLDLTRKLLDDQLPPLIYSDYDTETSKRYQEVVLHNSRLVELTKSQVGHIKNPTEFVALFLNAYHWSYDSACLTPSQRLDQKGYEMGRPTKMR
jgi:hypothetical protein